MNKDISFLIKPIVALMLTFFFIRQESNLQAQCAIDVASLGSISPPSGTTLCGGEALSLPSIDFTPDESFVNPDVMWAIYTGQPADACPLDDPINAGSFVIMVNGAGGPTFNGGEAFLPSNYIGDEESVTITIVPIITTDIEGDLEFNCICTGILAGFEYPTYTFLNPELNPDICDTECGGITNELDDCSTAFAFSISDPSSIENTVFDNYCSTAIDDPDFPGGEDCFFDDDEWNSTVWFSFTGNGGSYSLLTSICDGADDPLNDSQMAIYSGSCGELTFEACNEDETSLLAGITDFATTAGTDYYVVIDGWGENIGQFCFELTETLEPPTCEAAAGSISWDGESTVCTGVSLSATLSGGNGDAGYSSIYVIVDADGNATSSDAGSFDLAPGDYAVYSVNYLDSDEVSVLSIIEDGGVEALLLSELCVNVNTDFITASVLDETMEPCIPCESSFGTVDISLGEGAIEGTNEVCSGSVASFTLTGQASGDYASAFVITTGAPDYTIIDVVFGEDVEITFDTEGSYVVHAFNYDSGDAEEIIAAIEGGASGLDVQALIDSEDICASLQIDGYELTVLAEDDPNCLPPCVAEAGTASASVSETCAGETINFSLSGNSADGFNSYFLVVGPDSETINWSLTNVEGDFTLEEVGSYIVYTYTVVEEDDSDFSESISTIDELSSLSETLCLAVTEGVIITILGDDDPLCDNCLASYGTLVGPNTDTFCEGDVLDGILNFSFTGGSVDTFTTTFVLTTGSDLEIVSIEPNGVFMPEPGTYTVHLLNYLTTDEELVTTAATEGGVNAILAGIDDQLFCADLDATGTTFTVLAEDDYVCLNCDALSINAFSQSDSTTVCTGSSIEIGSTIGTGFDSELFEVYVVITQSGEAGLFVVGLQGPLSPEFSTSVDLASFGLEAGEYFVHGFIYYSGEAATVAELATVGTSVSTLLDALDNEELCGSLQTDGIPYTLLAADDPACADVCLASFGAVSPGASSICVGSSLSFSTDGDQGGEYSTLFALADVSTGTFINYNFSGEFTFNEVGTFTLHTLSYVTAAGEELIDIIENDGSVTDIVTVSDDDNHICLDIDIDGIEVNVLPVSDPGTMPSDLQIVCAGESVSVSATGSNLVGDDILVYALHTESGTSPGTILAANATGTFSGDGLDSNTEFYISAVTGQSDASGSIDLNSLCLQVAAGTPVVFLDPVGALVDEYCDWLTGEYHVTVFPTGGLPAYDSSTSYLVTGDFLGNVIPGTSIEVIFAEGVTDQYDFDILDDLGCSGDADSPAPFECTKTPIELLYFTGTAETNGNLLKWLTATETDNDYFTLERSINGLNFETIKQIDSQNSNSQEELSYSYLDENAPEGISYYRLSQTDFNGQESRSHIVSINRETASSGSTPSISIEAVYPNPADKNLIVEWQANGFDTELSTIRIIDITGRELMQLNSNDKRSQFDVSGLTAGMYFVSVEQGSVSAKTKWIKL